MSTGNTGLGREAARHFVKLGASKVIIAVRSTQKGEDAKKWIESSTNCAKDVIEVWSLDLASYESTKQFAERATRELPRIDALVANAGVSLPNFSKGEENELTITVNVVSTFLLVLLLLPKLKETASKFNVRPRVAVVSSELHGYAAFKEFKTAKTQNRPIFDVLSDEKTANMMDRYNTSKLLEVLAVQKLAELTQPAEKYPVTINVLNPGFCRSELTRTMKLNFAFRAVLFIMETTLARITEHGSRALVNGAVQGEESHGKYLSDCRVAPFDGLAAKTGAVEMQNAIWTELAAKLEKIQPGVTANL